VAGYAANVKLVFAQVICRPRGFHPEVAGAIFSSRYFRKFSGEGGATWSSAGGARTESVCLLAIESLE